MAATVLLTFPAAAQEMIPMAKGTTWTYSARVKWDRSDSQNAGVRTLTWTSTVIDTYRSGDLSAALLHGGPWDLAFYSPGTKPDDYLIVRRSDSYYVVMREARSKFADIKSGKVPDVAEDIWFQIPMEISDNYCAPDQEKTAPFYCWSVEKITTTHSLRIPGFSQTAATEYYLTFMTNPDTTTMTVVPGAGIVTYNYEHHGTIAEASVKLIRFREGAAKAARVAPRRSASKHVR